MLNSSSPTPEITITGAIDAVRICTTEIVGIPLSVSMMPQELSRCGCPVLAPCGWALGRGRASHSTLRPPNYNVPIMETADVVIIGGGIVGASVAWHLTESGCTNVLIVERETHQGKGSTGKSMGGVRAQFATTLNIPMSMYSINFYSQFDERLGQPA